MKIEDEFRVEVPIAEAWPLLLDIERIAPCLPGAQLQEIEGDEYRGIVKVKVGPITAQYRGSATLESVDDATHTAVIQASGRDTRGQGQASATVNLSLVPDGSGTKVSVSTDLAITGKVAQFGRGVLADVSAKLLAQFVENLERDVLLAPDDAAVGSPAINPVGAPGGPSGSADSSGNGRGRSGQSEPSTGARTIDGPEADPVDLLAVGGESVGRRLLPIGIGIVVVLVVIMGIRRRRRRRS